MQGMPFKVPSTKTRINMDLFVNTPSMAWSPLIEFFVVCFDSNNQGNGRNNACGLYMKLIIKFNDG